MTRLMLLYQFAEVPTTFLLFILVCVCVCVESVFVCESEK